MQALPGLFGVVLLLLPIVATAEGHTKYDKWLPVEEWAWDDARYDGMEGAAILYDGHVIDDSSLDSDQGAHHRYHRVRVLDPSGVEDFGTVEIVYLEDDKVRGLAARTLKPDGTQIDLSETDFYEKVIIEYGKERLNAKVFAFKGVAPGDILEYRYKITGPMDAPPLILLGGAQHTFAAEVTWLCKIVPPALRGKWEYENFVWDAVYVILNGKEYLTAQDPFPDERNREGSYFRFENIPPIVSEPFMPSFGEVAVSFVGHYRIPNEDRKEEYWKRIAKFLGDDVRPFVEDRDGLEDWVTEMTTRERNLESDLDAALVWIRSRWRCDEFRSIAERSEDVSVQRSVRDARKRPVLRSYDLDRIVVAMLHQLGYEATLFWGRSTESGAFVEQWQSVDQLDLAGVAVRDGEQIRWCFPSSPVGSPWALPQEIIGQTVLLADLSEGDAANPFPLLEWIDPPSSDRNLAELDVTLRPDPDLKARGRLQATWRCENEVLDTSELLVSPRDEVLSTLRDRVLPEELSWRAVEETFQIEGWTVSYTCSLEVDGIIVDAGSVLLADLSHLHIDDFDLEMEEPRKYGFRFPYPVRCRTNVAMNTPAGYEIETAGGPGYHKSESVADVTVQFSAAGTESRFERRVDLKYNLLLPAAAPVLADLIGGADAAAAEPIVFRRVPVTEGP